MSYVVDVYRGEQKAVRSPIDYALFICFFPQLVAGPIVGRALFFGTFSIGGRPGRDISHRHFPARTGPDQEDGVRRPVRQGRQPLFQQCRRQPGDGHRLERRVRLRAPNLFRFLGIHGHGDRDGEAAGLPFSGELSPSVSGLEHHGFLAPLAHFAVDLAAGLSIHSAGREPAWAVDDVPQPDDHYAAGGTMARRQLEFRHLGWVQWRAAQPGKGFPPQPARPRGMELAVPCKGHF